MKLDQESLKQQIRQEYQAGNSLKGLQRKYNVSYWSIHCCCGLSKKVNLRQTTPLPKGHPGKNPQSREQRIKDCKWKMNYCEIFCQPLAEGEAQPKIPFN